MWTVESRDLERGGRWFGLRDSGAPMSFRHLVELLEGSDEFSSWYSSVLAGLDWDGFFWEHPPVTEDTITRDAEFVVIPSRRLPLRTADPTAFSSHFDANPDADVLTFPNLRGDAKLVVPRPLGPLDAYGHLASFVRDAPASQIRSLWRTVARALSEHVGAHPCWLSTAGGGVPWLHVRLDTTPKYYKHRPYRGSPGAFFRL